jgi:branched-chain amino acid transport system substrate-binding protein
MKQLGLDIKLLGGESICSAEMGRLGGSNVDGNVYCARIGGMAKTPEANTFAGKYQRTPEVFAATYYDATMLMAQAMKEAQATSGPKLQAALQKIKYKGLAGSYAFDRQRDLLESPVTVFHFEAGNPVPIGTF